MVEIGPGICWNFILLVLYGCDLKRLVRFDGWWVLWPVNVHTHVLSNIACIISSY
jgi:hypothetical protein